MKGKEKEKLRKDAKLCGLTMSEYIRQLIAGREPNALPDHAFWDNMDKLYRIHDDIKKLFPGSYEAGIICGRIRELILSVTEAI